MAKQYNTISVQLLNVATQHNTIFTQMTFHRENLLLTASFVSQLDF
jgi:hypothetical protein